MLTTAPCWPQATPSPSVWGCTSTSARSRRCACYALSFSCSTFSRRLTLRSWRSRSFRKTISIPSTSCSAVCWARLYGLPADGAVAAARARIRPRRVSKTAEVLRGQQTHFLNHLIADLFGKFVILMQFNDFKPGESWKDYRVVMWESSQERPVFGNDVAYIQGLIDGFLATVSQHPYRLARAPWFARWRAAERCKLLCLATR